MTHLYKCDIFNQLYSFKVIDGKNPILKRKCGHLRKNCIEHSNEYITFKVIGRAHFIFPSQINGAFHLQIALIKVSLFIAYERQRNRISKQRTSIQCNAFINTWNIANFPKNIETMGRTRNANSNTTKNKKKITVAKTQRTKYVFATWKS